MGKKRFKVERAIMDKAIEAGKMDKAMLVIDVTTALHIARQNAKDARIDEAGVIFKKLRSKLDNKTDILDKTPNCSLISSAFSYPFSASG